MFAAPKSWDWNFSSADRLSRDANEGCGHVMPENRGRVDLRGCILMGTDIWAVVKTLTHTIHVWYIYLHLNWLMFMVVGQ